MSYVLTRLLWSAATLLGISLITFALLELAPLDARMARALDPGTAARDAESRAEAVRVLQERAGWIDEATGERRGAAERYFRWVADVARLELAPPGESPAAFRARIGSALSFSCLLGGLALGFALGFGTLLGSLADRWRGTRRESLLGTMLLVVGGLPDFLIGTLALVAIGAWGVDWPTAGLRGPSAGSESRASEFLDLGQHLLLPALMLALGPTVAIARYLRAGLSDVRRSEWVFTLRAWGIAESEIRRRVLRAAMRPLLTWLGTLLPLLITGAVVVEELFALPGFGRLALRAALDRELATVTATTTLTAAMVLFGLVMSDLLHRWFDPRVVLR